MVSNQKFVVFISMVGQLEGTLLVLSRVDLGVERSWGLSDWEYIEFQKTFSTALQAYLVLVLVRLILVR